MILMCTVVVTVFIKNVPTLASHNNLWCLFVYLVNILLNKSWNNQKSFDGMFNVQKIHLNLKAVSDPDL